MSIVRDKDIKKRVGVVYGDGTYLVVDDGRSGLNDIDDQLDDECSDSGNGPGIEDDIDIDNSRCEAEFEQVEDGYKGVPNCLAGTMRRMTKRPGDVFATCVGIYTPDGMYKMESSRAVWSYPGRDGRAECIAIPQCKMMNSTVLDGPNVRHPVYVGEQFHGIRLNGCKSRLSKDFNDAAGWLEEYESFDVDGTHVPFDLWCVVGAVYGKALKIWRGVAKLDWRRMPCWMYVTVEEVFEALNPGCRWVDLSAKSRLEWRKGIVEAFGRLNETFLAWDLPVEDGRLAYSSRILENSLVSRRVEAKDESACCIEWHDWYEPCGFKVHLRGSRIFDFCWRTRRNSPSVVQVRKYEHDVRKVLVTRGWTKCFHMIWASWLVQYRNYWMKRGMAYESCELVWSQAEMLRAFKDGVFEIRHLSTDEMKEILEYHTTARAAGERRPGHIGEVEVLKRCVVGWTLPRSLGGEDVLVKNDDGVNLSLEESGVEEVPDEVRFAKSRMAAINSENSSHAVTLEGRIVDATESVIYRVVKGDDGRLHIVEGRNGRCYSMKNGVQCLSREERAALLIDGMRVSEVDYSSLHPTMLYALNGIQFTGDVYNVGRWYLQYGLTCSQARKAVKKMLLIVLNARNKAMAMHAFKKDWNEEQGASKGSYIPWLQHLYNAIAKRHSAIAHEFCKGRGAELMNLDGKLMREVLHRLTRDGVCALGVHDSVIVQSRYSRKAAAVMREEYSRMFNGFEIKVK